MAFPPEPSSHRLPASDESSDSEAVEDTKHLQADEDISSSLQEFEDLGFGAKSTAKKLYEGPPKCKCCINWVEEYPKDLSEAVDQTTEARSHALLLRYAKSHNALGGNPLTLHSIVVQSPVLKSVVRTVLDKFPGVDADLTDLTFTPPFEPFFHRWNELLKQKQCDDPAKVELVELLIDTLKPELERDLKANAELTSHSNITFPLLWTLFPPGSVVFGQVNQKDQCFLVSNTHYRYTKFGTFYNMQLAYLDYDATGFGWRGHDINLSTFAGSKKISELEVVPQQHHNGPSELIERLTKRGKSIVELSKGGYKSYHGPIRISVTMEDMFTAPTKHVEGRFVIDPAGWHENDRCGAFVTSKYPAGLQGLVPGKKPKAPKPKKSKHRRTHRSVSPPLRDPLDGVGYASDHSSGDDYARSRRHRRGSDIEFIPAPRPAPYFPPPQPPGGLFGQPVPVPYGGPAPPFGYPQPANLNASPADVNLDAHEWVKKVFNVDPEVFCRSVVRGYCLTSKCWAEFEESNIKDIEWNANAFDMVVMAPGRKRLLKALVEEQKNHKADLDDVIEGKGQGLVVLLSGPTGTGKTLTAESIADRLRMPLYALDGSQLGDQSQDIEHGLNQVLRLTAKWNAVLLLDEADAFLDKRQDGPWSREINKRVAAFLRVLEYYKGVMILTTNRPITFDDAFYSRIHLTLRFPELDFASRKTVWGNFLKPAGTDLSDGELEVLAEKELNGRQIKNIIKMARLLAKNDGKELSTTHIKDVMDVLKHDMDLTKKEPPLPPPPPFAPWEFDEVPRDGHRSCCCCCKRKETAEESGVAL